MSAAPADLISVGEALARVTGGVAPLRVETVPLAQARGRVLGGPLAARRTQPGFDASAMDGYALRAADAAPGGPLRLIGEAAAGHAFGGAVAAGEAVRIFTGAPLPDGADAVLIQEQARREGASVAATAPVKAGQNIRRRGLDFSDGEALLAAGTRLGPRDLALAAASGHADLAVTRRPRVAILATGDEIVLPGGPVGPHQTVASNTFALAAMAQAEGAEAIDLGIAGDSFEALAAAIARAREAAADVLVTVGGASVGDHDLVQQALAREGMRLGFWRIAMRPGKPMMHGLLERPGGPMHVLGLPGNPVSAIVCGVLFLAPLLRALAGRADIAPPRSPARWAVDVPANDLREDYLRATSAPGPQGAALLVTPLPVQDSSMVRALAGADCLAIRPPHAPPAQAGEACEIIDLAAAAF